MAEKFFLFKRADPSVQGGAVFSDNGKGISAVSFPAKNLSYMAADRGAIVMYFNESAPFEENSLTLAGESFEKTSVTVSCEVGREVDLMENIINFINKRTNSDVMKFDSSGESNTFASITPFPVIDAKVRARPVERGLVGSDAVVTGLDTNAVVDGIDFFKVANKPFIDFDANNLTSFSDNAFVTGWANGGTSGSNYDFASSNNTGNLMTVLYEADEACSTKSIGFNRHEAFLKVDFDFSNGGTASHVVATSVTSANLDEELSNNVAYIPAGGGTGTSYDHSPRFKLSTDASANVTELKASFGGSRITAGDQIVIGFPPGDAISYTVQADELTTQVKGSTIEFIAGAGSPDAPFPSSDYVVYAAIIIPDGAFAQPFYGCLPSENDTQGLNRSYVDQMGPFTVDSSGVDFEVNHGQPTAGFQYFGIGGLEFVDSIQSAPFSSSSNTFSYTKPSGLPLSEKNLHVYVIRRDSNRNVYVYSRDGELIATRPPNSNDDETKLTLSEFGLVLPFDASKPQMRIARFGIISKDIGDLLCRNIADQLYTRYRP